MDIETRHLTQFEEDFVRNFVRFIDGGLDQDQEIEVEGNLADVDISYESFKEAQDEAGKPLKFAIGLTFLDVEDLDFYTEDEYRESFANVLGVLIKVKRDLRGQDAYMVSGAYMGEEPGLFVFEINEDYLEAVEVDKAYDMFFDHLFI